MWSSQQQSDFYPRPPRGGRRLWSCVLRRLCPISIHALREEGDTREDLHGSHAGEFLSTPSARRATRPDCKRQGAFYISIHALREEGDLKRGQDGVTLDKFLSTPSARRATSKIGDPGEEWPISIHALREEGDRRRRWTLPACPRFLSTPSARRATTNNPFDDSPAWISIHALREEGDVSRKITREINKHFYPRPPRGGRRKRTSFRSSPGDFYPRPPRGGRRKLCPVINCYRLFLSTPSARRATFVTAFTLVMVWNFYPRPPRGGRRRRVQMIRRKEYFYPRPPRGGRPSTAGPKKGAMIFLSTPSARRATPRSVRFHSSRNISIHALREEGDASSLSSSSPGINFYPRPPRGGRPPSCRRN